MNRRSQVIWTLVILANITFQLPAGSVGVETGWFWYSSICLLAHCGGLAMIWLANRRPNRLAAYFGLQTILFPLGWMPLFWFLPVVAVFELFTGFDGETLTDPSLNSLAAHVLWWAISLVATLHGLALADRKREVKFEPTMA